MKDFVKRMIEEHADLQIKIFKLDAFIYSGDAKEICVPEEYANACIQLKAMRNYEDALRARLLNHGIEENNGKYFEQVGEIITVSNPTEPTGKDDKEPTDKTGSPEDDGNKREVFIDPAEPNDSVCGVKFIFFD